jgi:kinesin family member 11
MDSKSSTDGVNVQVAVRCRPVDNEEKKAGLPSVVQTDVVNKKVSIQVGKNNNSSYSKTNTKTFTFDKVFGMYSTQEEIFQSLVKPIVDECLMGFNCTIFAYGQTGTGKTHTMEGDIHSEDNAGIVPRAVKSILETLEGSGSEFTIRVSFLELYNEELQDLLVTSNPSSSSSASNKNTQKQLKLCYDDQKGVVCQNLEEITVLNAKDIFDILQRGIQQRQTAATLCNKNSSRSHSIFTLKIMIKECNVDGEEVVRHGQLNLVDLAGSECVGRSGAKNDRAREAGSINQSLLTLGRVITALVDHHGHIPYRDSKLTRLLQESLGGKAKTCIIATLSPSQLAVEETLSTLDYAHRAKSIKNIPTVNQKMTKKTVLKEYCEEIETLRNQLQLTRDKNGVYVDPEVFYQMERRLSAQESQIGEVESALSLRQEECKTLKIERDGFEKKNMELETDVKESKAKLEKLQGDYNTVIEEKAQMEVELQGSNAIIDEQVANEEHLHTIGQDFVTEINVQRNDRDILLSKLDTMKSLEKNNVSTTEKYVSNFVAKSDIFANKVDNMLRENGDKHKLLEQGVSTLLIKGQQCSLKIKESIDEALSVLTTDADEAKQKMKTQCEGLSSELNNANEMVKENLMSLSTDLSTWLNELNTKMSSSMEILQDQHKEIDNVQTVVSEHLMAISDEYENHKTAMEKLQQEQQTSMKDKQEEVEKTIMESIRDIFSFHTQSMTSIQTTSSSLIESIANKTNKHNEDVLVMMNTVGEKRKVIETDINDVCANVGDKKVKLQEGNSTVMNKVNECVTLAKKQLHETSEEACMTFDNVQSASSKMNESTQQSMQLFNNYMTEHGMTLKDDIQLHFNTVGEQFNENKEIMSVMKQECNELELDHSHTKGDTPSKRKYDVLREMTHTRDHNSIRSEVTEGRWSKPSAGTYNSITSSASSPDSTVDDDIVESMPVIADNEEAEQSSTSNDAEAESNDEESVKSTKSAPESVTETETETETENKPPATANRRASAMPKSAKAAMTNSRRSTRRGSTA